MRATYSITHIKTRVEHMPAGETSHHQENLEKQKEIEKDLQDIRAGRERLLQAAQVVEAQLLEQLEKLKRESSRISDQQPVLSPALTKQGGDPSAANALRKQLEQVSQDVEEHVDQQLKNLKEQGSKVPTKPQTTKNTSVPLSEHEYPEATQGPVSSEELPEAHSNVNQSDKERPPGAEDPPSQSNKVQLLSTENINLGIEVSDDDDLPQKPTGDRLSSELKVLQGFTSIPEGVPKEFPEQPKKPASTELPSESTKVLQEPTILDAETTGILDKIKESTDSLLNSNSTEDVSQAPTIPDTTPRDSPVRRSISTDGSLPSKPTKIESAPNIELKGSPEDVRRSTEGLTEAKASDRSKTPQGRLPDENPSRIVSRPQEAEELHEYPHLHGPPPRLVRDLVTRFNDLEKSANEAILNMDQNQNMIMLKIAALKANRD